MSNQIEMDYEKKFQEDLAKATALSLEQQALDEYQRTKKYGPSYSTTPSSTANAYLERAQSIIKYSNSGYYAQTRFRPNTINTSRHLTSDERSSPPSIVASPTALHRRHSEVSSFNNNVQVTAPLQKDSRASTIPPSPPPSSDENDLISFASPTANKTEHSTFERLIEDLQKLQTTGNNASLVPLGPTAAGRHNMYARPAGPIASTAVTSGMYASQFIPGGAAATSMQIVPFVPPPTQQQKIPLTQEELQKLYSMPKQQHVTPYAVHTHAPMGFVVPSGTANSVNSATLPYQPTGYTSSMPVVGAAAPSAAYIPYAAPYGFRYAATSAVGTPSSGVYYQQHSTNQSVSGMTTASALAQPTSATVVGSGSPLSNVASARRPTPPSHKRAGGDLIDLSHEDDSRVSVLEAFDPLHQGENDCVWKNNQHIKNVAN